MLLGAHESVAGGLEKALMRGAADGCETIQIFTKNASTWKEPALTPEQIKTFRTAHAKGGCIPLMAHTSYLINLATADEAALAKSTDALVNEVLRASALGVAYVVLHPGAHVGAGTAIGISRVAAALDDAHARTPGASARILIENTAGQGTCIGHRFEEIAGIFAETKTHDRLGVCFDTQHAYAAGYDLATDEGYDATFAAFDRQVGLAHLHAFHLNDSKKALGSRVDRHEHVGEGILGLGVFEKLTRDIRFRATPAVIEIEPRGEKESPYRDEVAMLKRLARRP